jgi:hypothetical protein
MLVEKASEEIGEVVMRYHGRRDSEGWLNMELSLRQMNE